MRRPEGGLKYMFPHPCTYIGDSRGSIAGQIADLISCQSGNIYLEIDMFVEGFSIGTLSCLTDRRFDVGTACKFTYIFRIDLLNLTFSKKRRPV